MKDELVLQTVIGGHDAAIPAMDVQSVIELDGFTPVPGAPDHIVGLAALRSQALTVIDCRIALRLDTDARQPAPGVTGQQAIVVEVDNHFYALIVDIADDVTACLSEVKPVSGAMGANWASVARGMIETAQGATLLIDPAAFIRGHIAAAA